MFNYAVERQCEEAVRVINITCKKKGNLQSSIVMGQIIFPSKFFGVPYISAVTVVHLYLFKCLIYDPF